MDVTIREQDGRRAIAVEVLSPPGDHRARALARRIARMKERYRNYLYLEVMPQGEQERPPLNERQGFTLMQDGVAMQICNFSDKR